MSTATATATVDGIFDRLASTATDRQEKAEQAFHALVLRLADGKEVPKLQDVERVLDDAGRTGEDLRGDVARVLTRRQALADVEDGRVAAGQAAEACREISALDVKLRDDLAEAEARIREAHARALAPVEARLADAHRREAAGRAGGETLRRTAGPEYDRLTAEAGERERAARDAAADVADEARELRDTIKRCDHNLAVYQRRAAGAPRGHYDAEITSTSKALDNYRERLAALTGRAEERATALRAEAAGLRAEAERVALAVE